MNQNQTALRLAASTILAAGLLAGVSGAYAASPAKQQCFGISKAGQNDCGGVSSMHSCAGQSKMDNDPNDFKLVASGTCEQMGGSLTPGKK